MVALTLTEVYAKLLSHHGPQEWWPAESRFEVIVGAVLVQSTAWRNAERAIANLIDAEAMSPSAIRELDVAELESLIRPSGFFRIKARRLRALCVWLGERFGDDLKLMDRRPTSELRNGLLSVNGVGAETADDILLYALDRPQFVVDAFTRRVFHRLGLCQEDSDYHALQRLFHNGLPRDPHLFNEYHALIVRHGNTICMRTPACGGCPLLFGCPRVGV